MKICIKTKIEKNYQVVFSKFNLDLFLALKPPLINLIVERFDGCKKGDEVHLVMDLFGKINQKWVSQIIADSRTDYEIYFVDKGVILPPPLKKWKHVHRIEKINELSSYVVDDIEYSCGSRALDLIVYPALYSMFLFRVPVYKRMLS